MTSVPAEAGRDPERAFGAENRARLLDIYFASVAPEAVTEESAWRHTYRLLMWIDRTIGLAHCYESDKCQPGRPWYGRSLAFHGWLSAELGTEPAKLSKEIDWLFGTAVQDLARATECRSEPRLRRASQQRRQYAGLGMPLPGEDPELEVLIQQTLEESLTVAPPDLVRVLVERIQTYLGSENKRKNLVGEGFEDTLAGLLWRLPRVSAAYDIYLRPPLHELPGFNPARGGDKTKKVDLAMVRRSDKRRVLVSCKWSIRSDREEQFATDFDAYAGLESSGQAFDYILVTNEFDPARLAAACDNRRHNSEIFSDVVHVNPLGPRSAYSARSGTRATQPRGGQARALAHMDTGRLTSLESWLTALTA